MGAPDAAGGRSRERLSAQLPRQVADLELDRGEVRLPTPIVKVDPAAAHTEIGQLGSAADFLELSAEEAAFLETKLALSERQVDVLDQFTGAEGKI